MSTELLFSSLHSWRWDQPLQAALCSGAEQQLLSCPFPGPVLPGRDQELSCVPLLSRDKQGSPWAALSLSKARFVQAAGRDALCR